MRTIAIVNFKGGVGKTITAVNMAGKLATEHEQRVLLIDCDSQGNATKFLLPPEGDYNTVALAITGEEPYYKNLIYQSQYRNLDVIPADMGLVELDLKTLTGQPQSINGLRNLRDVLIEDDAYDTVIFDCPTSPSAACAAALAAADSIIIPIKLDMFSVSGMKDLTTQIDNIRRINPEIRVAGLLITMWYQTEEMQAIADNLGRVTSVPVYRTHIRRTNKMDGSTWARELISIWSPQCGAAVDYRCWVSEYLEQEGKRHG